MTPVLVLGLWMAATLSWWAFAFMPLPSDAPPWLEAARHVCFGPMESGLPGLDGWILLAVAPATFLAFIVALWRPDLGPSLRRLARSRAGQAVLVVLAVAVAAEGTWVAAKLRTAHRVASADAAVGDLPAELPRDYPRRTVAAPDFALVDQHGETISLRRLAGRPIVLTFVFAHCQSICPVLVETIKRATPGGPPAQVLLVTLDPWRDTVTTLPSIARQWDIPPGFHVLSARRVEDLLDVVRAYEVPFQRNEQTGDVTHPGLLFVIDGDGRLAFTFNNPPVAWVREALDRLGKSDRTAG
jgi:protein SCO1/2